MLLKKIHFVVLLFVMPDLLVAQSEFTSHQYTIDFAKDAKTNQVKWKNTGFTPGDLLLDEDMHLSLDYLGALPGQGVSYLRPHWMLNLVGSRGIETESPEFNFNRLDAAFDEIVGRGLKPIFEIMGFPSLSWSVGENVYDDAAQAQKNQAAQWNPVFEREEDYKKWYDFIYTLISHLEERYGEHELKTWFFECTNEPDIDPHFWDRGIPSLLNYWDATSEAIKAVNEDYQFGGPGVARGLSDEFKAVVAHCDTGTNVITGKRGAVLDFISVHRKALPYQMIDMEKEVIEYIREKHPRFKDLPFWNDEADPTWGWSQRYWWRAHPWYAAFVAQSLDAHNRLLVDSMGVNYGILVNDHGFLGDWYQRTLTAEYTNPDEDNQFWLFKKPVLSVMTMLALGEGSRFQVEGYASTRESVSVIPSRTKNGDVVVILANRPDFGVVHDGRNQNEDFPLHQKEKHDRQGASVKLSLKNLGIENPELMQVQLDALHGNAHGAWKSIGKPDTVTSDVYRMIAANMYPVVVAEGVDLDYENLHLILPPSSVTMLIIRDKNMEKEFLAPEITDVNDYTGYYGERKSFIKWQQSEGAIVRYNVYASYDDDNYKRINPSPVFDVGYLNVVPDNVDSVKYKIDVVW